ncbi:MAG: head GIN domain-containing protein [Hyphomonadaceae bacterium]
MKAAHITAALVLGMAGAAHAESRALSGFTGVSASAGVDVEVNAGSEFAIDVSGPDASRIITRVSGNTLVVEPERRFGFHWGRHHNNARVRVSMPQIESLDASSGAQLAARGVNGGDISLDASSGANIEVAGACATFRADASSGADIHAAHLLCENGSVDVSSGATVRVYASNRIDVDASSGGDVLVSGDPGIGSIDLSSGGSLRRVN